MRSGFDFGIPEIRVTVTPPNHLSARSQPDAVDKVVEKETEKGRWRGPLSRTEVERLVGPFQTSPLGIIPKANGDVRLVQDFSWPRDGPYASINAFIDSDEFITAWDGVRAVIDTLLKLDPDVQGASMDGKDAFRTCLAKPSQWPGLVVQTTEDVFFLDLFLPFGLVSATGVWGMVADATRSIIVKRMCGRVVILKWIDDFLVLRTDSAVSLEDVRAAAEGLDFAWNEAKTADFSPRPIYIGWEWRIKERKVVLPRKKAESYREKAAAFRSTVVGGDPNSAGVATACGLRSEGPVSVSHGAGPVRGDLPGRQALHEASCA
ncbi:hypothetical protein CF335_g6174 [Tilletia laevis]|nr:hypothetical protein CF335_g6174 [Tilletia laevis]